MNRRGLGIGLGGLAVAAGLGFAGALSAQDTTSTPPAPLYAGLDSVGGQPSAQADRPALYFEGKAHWPSLGIDAPRTAWEFAQRAMYRQDALDDEAGAIEDYLAAEALDDHLLIVQGRLAYLALERGRAAERADRATEADAGYAEAIDRYERVLHEQPDRQGLRLRIAAAHLGRARCTNPPGSEAAAEAALEAELALAPTQQEAFYMLAELFAGQGRTAEARGMYRAYLAEAALQGDPSPWRLALARRRLDAL